MRKATVRELRNNFGLISRWLDAGEEVSITKNGKPYARLHPDAPKKVEMPDFAARAKKLFGGRVLDTSGWMAELRKERFER